MLTLFKSVDFPHLQQFILQAAECSSSKVQIVLDTLQHATLLLTIVLDGADITQEQREQMHSKGIEIEETEAVRVQECIAIQQEIDWSGTLRLQRSDLTLVFLKAFAEGARAPHPST
ncbi:hypothetical protein BGX27_000871 [Mortierella sp. AM989]|nr:hypothetical protein BGX27_000871 [Mortierella sp. AM989]